MATPYQSGKLPTMPRTRDEYLAAEKTIAAQFTDGEFEFLSIQCSLDSFPTCRTKRGDTIQQWQINGEGLDKWTVGAMEWSKTQDQIEEYQQKMIEEMKIRMNRKAVKYCIG